jgi:hypothetical protein
MFVAISRITIFSFLPAVCNNHNCFYNLHEIAQPILYEISWFSQHLFSIFNFFLGFKSQRIVNENIYGPQNMGKKINFDHLSCAFYLSDLNLTVLLSTRYFLTLTF